MAKSPVEDIPISISTADSASQVQNLTNRINQLYEAVNKLGGAFSKLPEGANFRSTMGQLNQMLTAIRTVNADVALLGAARTGARNLSNAVSEAGVQRAQRAGNLGVRNALRSSDVGVVGNALEASDRRANQLLLRIEQLGQAIKNTGRTPQQRVDDEKALKAAQDRLTKEQQTNNAIRERLNLLQREAQLQSGVTSRLRSREVSQRYRQTPEAISDAAQKAEEDRIFRSLRAQQRRIERERASNDRADALREEITRTSAALERQDKDRNRREGIRLANQTPDGRIATARAGIQYNARAWGDLQNIPEFREILVRNRTAGVFQGLQAANNAQQLPGASNIMASLAARGQQAQLAGNLQNLQNPGYVSGFLQANFQRAQLGLQSRQQLFNDRRFQDANNQMARQQMVERLTGDGGAALMSVQAASLRNFAVLSGVIGGFTAATKAVVDFDNALKNLQAISDSTNVEMRKLQDTIVEVSRNTRFTAVELTAAATTMAQAGLGVREINTSLQNVALIATATGSSLQTAVDIATSALSVYRLRADETGSVANQMVAALNLSKLTMEQLSVAFQYVGNTAADAGLSFSETTAALATLANQGIRSGSTMGTNLRQMMVDLMTPNENLRKRMHELGLSMADVDIRTNGLAGAIQNMVRAGFTAGDAFETMELRGANAWNALARGSRGMLELEQAILTARGAAQANAIQMESLSSKFIQLYNNTVAIAVALSGPFVEALRSGLGGLNSLIGGVDQTNSTLGVFGSILAGLAIAATMRWLFTLAGGFEAVTAAVIATRTAMAGFTAVAATAGTATAAFAAAKVALAAALGPLAFIAAVGAIATYILSVGNATSSTREMAAELDRLKASHNEARAAVDATKGALNSLDSFMETQLNRSRLLRENQDALNTAVAQARERFGDLSRSVWDNISSYDALIGRLRTVRGELQATLGLQLDSARMANREQAAALERSISAPFRPGQAQSQLFQQMFGRAIRPGEIDVFSGTIAERALQTEVTRLFGANPEALQAARLRFGLERRQEGTSAGEFLPSIGAVMAGLANQRASTNPQQRAFLEAFQQFANENSQISVLDVQNDTLGRSARANSVAQSPQFREVLTLIENFRASDRRTLDSFPTLAGREEYVAGLRARFQAMDTQVRALLQGMTQQDRDAFASSSQGQGFEQLRSQVQGTQRELARTIDETLIGDAERAVRSIGRQIQEQTQIGSASRDPAVRRAALERIRELNEQLYQTRLRAIVPEMDRGQDVAGQPTDVRTRSAAESVEALRFERDNSNRTAAQSVNQAFIQEIEQRLRAEQRRLSQLQANSRTRGQRQGTDAQIGNQRETVNRMIRELSEARGESEATVRARLEGAAAGYDQNDGAGRGGGGATRDPNREFGREREDWERFNTQTSRRLTEINRRAATDEREANISVLEQRARIDAARRMPNQLPEAVLRQRRRALNETEITAQIRIGELRERQLAELETVKNDIDQRIAQIQPRLDQLNAAHENRQLRSEAELNELRDYTRQYEALITNQSNAVAAIDRARQQVQQGRALARARSEQSEGGIWEGFQDAASTLAERSGVSQSSRVMWGETFTEMMQGATASFREFVQAVTSGSMTAGDAFKRMMSSMLQSAAQAAGNRALNMILGLVLKSVTSAFTGGATVSATPEVASFEGLGSVSVLPGRYHGGVIPRFAAGGVVPGANIGRDNVLAALAGGEGILNHRAMSVLGNDFVHAANAGAVSTASNLQPLQRQREPDNVNVYVVAPDQKPSLTAKDVVYIIGEDIATGGTTKRLVRQVSLGG